jgi:hypothetical protein
MVILQIPEVSARHCRAGNKKGVRIGMSKHAVQGRLRLCRTPSLARPIHPASRLPACRLLQAFG